MLFLETEKFIRFLIKHNLSADQFLYMYLVYQRDSGYVKGLFYEYNIRVTFSLLDEEQFDDLLNRNYIVETGAGTPEWVDNYELSPSMQKKLLMDGGEAAEELWENYPSYMYSDGKNFPLKGDITLDDLEVVYPRMINNNVKEHYRVINIVKRANNQGIINMGIGKFVKTKQWREMEKLLIPENNDNHGNGDPLQAYKRNN